MNGGLLFFVNSVLFGVGLAMDAFSVSMANGLNEPEMPKKKECLIAGAFGVFQTLMPMIGWILVHTAMNTFREIERFIPWIALILLCYIGGKMIAEGIRAKKKEESSNGTALGTGMLLAQAVATSIDALSVGFTIAEYDLPHAAVESVIIGVVTFVISFAGIRVGKKFGTSLSGKASVFGGVILVLIGIEIFISHL